MMTTFKPRFQWLSSSRDQEEVFSTPQQQGVSQLCLQVMKQVIGQEAPVATHAPSKFSYLRRLFLASEYGDR